MLFSLRWEQHAVPAAWGLVFRVPLSALSLRSMVGLPGSWVPPLRIRPALGPRLLLKLCRRLSALASDYTSTHCAVSNN